METLQLFTQGAWLSIQCNKNSCHVKTHPNIVDKCYSYEEHMA